MKRCGGCGLIKSLEEFRLKSRATEKRSAKCIVCDQAYQRDWYLKNRERHAARAGERRTRWRAHLTQLIDDAKNVPCSDCGGRYPSYVMDFDHVAVDKLANVANLRTGSLERLLGEMRKCDVVCANCHRLRTRSRRIGGSR